jgi:hypothetical protein
VPIPGAALALGQKLPPSVPNGIQHELRITTAHHFGNTGWTIFAAVDGGQDTALGYYPDSDYAAGGLGTMADTFWTGGEVYDQTGDFKVPATVQMGASGITILGASYGYTAYQDDFYYYNENNAIVTQTTGNPNYDLWSDQPSVYTFDAKAAAGSSQWLNHFYFGDVAKLILFPPPKL